MKELNKKCLRDIFWTVVYAIFSVQFVLLNMLNLAVMVLILGLLFVIYNRLCDIYEK